MRRFPALDGLRAIAALSVVAFHAGAASQFNEHGSLGGLTSRGDAGVALFFLLSGFLLYRPFKTAQLELVGFYWRRLLRIVPAYWLALVVLSIYPGLAAGPWDGDWWKYLLFLQNLWTDTVQGGIGPAWTLCVEMSFYLLLPAYARALSRASVRTELTVLGAIFAASLLVRWWALEHPDGTLYFTLPAFGTWFSLGMGLAVWQSAGRPLPGPTSAWWSAAALLFVLIAYALDLPRGVFQPTTTGRALAEHVGYGVVALLLLIPAVRDDAPRLLQRRPLAWLGLVSYGIYLYHAPLVAEAGPGSMFRVVALGAGGAILCAAVSFYALERPVLSLKARRPRARTG